MERRFMLKDNGLQIPCVLEEPEYCDPRRCIIGVHSFCGSKDSRVLVDIVEEMGLFGAATVRFDFPCHGENPTEVFTLKGCVDTLLSVARWIRQDFPHVEDLCIFASGFGAYVTLVALEELVALPGKVKLVVQTPSVMMHTTLLAMRRITLEQLQRDGKTTFQVARPFDATIEFYRELADNIVLIAQPIPMLILHGEQDDFIHMEDIQNFRRVNEDSKLVIIPGTSHRFLEDGAWDMVLDLTRDWFSFEQVLLCDWE